MPSLSQSDMALASAVCLGNELKTSILVMPGGSVAECLHSPLMNFFSPFHLPLFPLSSLLLSCHVVMPGGRECGGVSALSPHELLLPPPLPPPPHHPLILFPPLLLSCHVVMSGGSVAECLHFGEASGSNPSDVNTLNHIMAKVQPALTTETAQVCLSVCLSVYPPSLTTNSMPPSPSRR